MDQLAVSMAQETQREIREIDWKKDKVYCFEAERNIILVHGIILALEAKDNIPLVSLVELEPHVYATFYHDEENRKDGGHHRIKGYFIAGVKMPFIIPNRKVGPDGLSVPVPRFLVEEVELFDHREIKSKWYRDRQTKDFYVRSRSYPRIDWEAWNLPREDPRENDILNW